MSVIAAAGSVKYECYGFINHIGASAKHGHYTACVRIDGGKWYLIDDTKPTIEPTDPGEVRGHELF